MSVRLRLTRVGSKKNPIWRVVVADQRSPRDGRFIESIGHYNPQTDPSTIVIDESRLEHWLSRGAEPTGTVKNLIKANSRSAEAPAPAETAAPDEPEPAPAEPAEDSSPEQAAPGEAVAPAEDDNPAAAASGEGDAPAEESAG